MRRLTRARRVRRAVLLAGLAVPAAGGLAVAAGSGGLLPGQPVQTALQAVLGPPTPRITQAPPARSSAWRQTFAFTDRQAGVGFQCRLDDGDYTPCSSPKHYDELAAGAHTFRVRAVDSAGRTSIVPAVHTFVQTVERGMPFTITASTTGRLLPGSPPLAIPLRLANPNATTIDVVALTVTLDAARLPAGCDPAWYHVTQANATADRPVTVPAGSTVTLPAQGVTAPTIALRESGTRQDACAGAPLTLTFTGKAHS